MAESTEQFGWPINPAFLASVEAQTGLPASLIESLEKESDWAFVIKAHAIVEAALNHIIMHALGDERLHKIIARLDTSDRTRGKLAYVKALELFPQETRNFIAMFSELRNSLVHDAKQFTFSFADWIEKMEPTERKNFFRCLSFDVPVGKSGEVEPTHTEIAVQNPRLAIFMQCLTILGDAADYSVGRLSQTLKAEMTRLEGLIRSFEAGQKSTPKES